MRNYPRLEIEQFGKVLLTTGDLDPVYIGLVKAELPAPTLGKWLMAYWCLYHAGLASYLADQTDEDFWGELHRAADNEDPSPVGGRWPRGKERRHWRGAQAIDSMTYLWSCYQKDGPAQMIEFLKSRAPKFAEVSRAAQTHRGFGPWISFKMGDMLERVVGTHVDFSEAEVFMFKDPVEAALMLWRKKAGLPENAQPKDQAQVISEVVKYLTDYFNKAGYKAPPLADRQIGLQEVETILCKWKSHMRGHYPLCNDIHEIRDGLGPWAKVSNTAIKLLETMPQAGFKGEYVS